MFVWFNCGGVLCLCGLIVVVFEWFNCGGVLCLCGLIVVVSVCVIT